MREPQDVERVTVQMPTLFFIKNPKNAESGASAGDVILMRTKIKFMWLCVLLLIAGKAQAWISYGAVEI